MVSRWRMGVVVSSAMLLSACGGGGGGAEVNGDVLTGKQTTYSLGGVVMGLSTGTLTLANAADGRALDTLQIVGTGATELSFTFAKELPTQTGYAISVLTSPSGLGCSVVNGSSRTNTAAVTNIQINCEPNAYNVSGTVTGLVGSGLQLKNNAADTLNVAASTPVGNVPFNFPTALNGAASYAVTVATQPVNPTQNCVVTNGSGAGTGSNINTVAVSCSTQSFTVGGHIADLVGTGLQLQNNGGNTVTITPNATSFTFPAIPSGATYNVTVLGPTTNPVQNCVVSQATATGVVLGSNIDSVLINCSTNTYTVGGNVTGLGSNNSGLQLQLSKNGSAVETKPIAGDGGFAFSQTLTDGNAYSVAISTPHGHYVCTLTNVSGQISGSNVSNVGVSCVAPIVVTVSGLGASNAGLVLSNSYGISSSADTTRAVETLTIAGDGAFQFSTRLPSARAYTITVSTPHPDYQCTISNGDSLVGAAPINITVACTERTYIIGGTVNGLATSSTGLVLRRIATGYANEDLTITPTNNPVDFTFLTKLPTNRAFTIIEVSEPDDRLCAFTNTTNSTTGTIARANVTSIVMNCTVPAALTVSSVTPTNNATNVALGAPISITFSAPVEPATVNSSSITLLTPQGNHPASVSVNNTVINVTPVGKLMPLTNYTLKISSSIRGLNKEVLATSSTGLFSTSHGWTSSVNLGLGTTFDGITGFPFALDAQIAFAANGNAVIVWNGVAAAGQSCSPIEFGGEICFPYYAMSILSRRFDASTQIWSNTETLGSAAGDGNLQLASDTSGNAVAIWVEAGGIWERRYSASTATWQAAQQINSTGRSVLATRLAMRANGAALLVTTEIDGTNARVYIRQFDANTLNWNASTWTAATAITASNVNTSNPHISIAESGHSLVLWQQQNSSPGFYASYNATLDTTGWSAPAIITSNSGYFDLDVSIDSAGNALAGWSETNGSGSILYAKRFSPDTGWEAIAQILGEGVGFTAFPHTDAPRVSVRSANDAVVTWLSPTGVQRRQLVSGIWLGSQLVGGSSTSYHTLFSDTFGTVSILWTQDAQVSVSRYSSSTGTWSASHVIDTVPGTVLLPAVGVNAIGTAIALWSKNTVLYGSRFVLD